MIVATDQNVCVNGTNLNLSLIDGYEELGDRQQRYLQEYAKDPENKTLAAMQLGYKTNEVNNWFGQEDFASVASSIYDIYTEVLKGIDFRDAIDNSKIRNRVIKARENGGKYSEDKTTTHQHLHATGESLADVLKLLNG
ncbi:MAG TPA: hypothetical protein VK982_13265 [Bacteroidales bacterium]|nr:hypothetical protein [Bacteroidales bacterium]